MTTRRTVMQVWQHSGMDETVDFRDLVQDWIRSACDEWGYPQVSGEPYCDRVTERIPAGVGALIANGYREGAIVPVGGHKFTLRGLSTGKGPYAWVSRSAQTQIPAMNWEYLVQVAEFIRLRGVLPGKHFVVKFEDRLMDLTVSDPDGALRWYVEVKEQAGEVPLFLDAIKAHGNAGVDLDRSDRGNDPLRKAKYLVRYQPSYFSVAAIGVRHDFRVSYQGGNRFGLFHDMVPFA